MTSFLELVRGSTQRLGPDKNPDDPTLEELTKEQSRFRKRLGNCSFNHKDRWGVLLVIMVLVILRIVLEMLLFGFEFAQLFTILFVCAGIVGIIAWEPIRILYLGSSLFAIFLRTPEIMDRTLEFPNHKRFEDPKVYTKIQESVRAYVAKLNNGEALVSTKDTFDGENDYIGSGGNGKKQWRIQLIQMLGIYGHDVKKHLPELCDAIDNSPEVVSCVLSVLDAGVKIPMHVGYYKGLMRYMLPITIPKDREKIWLNVNGIHYTWTEGEGVLWDDTFPHAVYNRTEEKRIVLYMDVLRNVRMPWYARLINSFTTSILKISKIADAEIAKTEVVVKL